MKNKTDFLLPYALGNCTLNEVFFCFQFSTTNSWLLMYVCVPCMYVFKDQKLAHNTHQQPATQLYKQWRKLDLLLAKVDLRIV